MNRPALRIADMRPGGALTRIVVVIGVAVASCGPDSRRGPEPGRLPPLGDRVLVLAPHPDDEALGAAGLIDAAVRAGAVVHVVVATDGEAGPDNTGVPDLGGARRAESRQALATLGVPADRVAFLGFADGSLAGSWTEGWTARPRDGDARSAATIVEALRVAIRRAAPDTVVLPIAGDVHPDHRALHQFGLLALLAERVGGRWPRVLSYLIHAPEGSAESRPAGCPGSGFRWTGLRLGREAADRKASVIAGYRSQIGRTRKLMRFAGATEAFAREDPIRAPAAMTPTRPGVRATPAGIVVHVPRGPCAADAGDRVRLRFFDGEGVAERVVTFAPVPRVRGGRPGERLDDADDVHVRLTARSIRLRMAAALAGVGGGLLELVPDDAARAARAWVLVWR